MLKPFEIFMSNISIISKGIEQLKTEVMKQFSLKGNQGMFLFYLLRHPEGLTVSQLSELANIDKAAVSRSLSELYKNDYIHYPEHRGGKKYNTPAILTDSGKDVVKKIDIAITKVVDCVSLSNITEEERTIMYHSLKNVAANIENYLNGSLKF